jgi:hypothetical protein
MATDRTNWSDPRDRRMTEPGAANDSRRPGSPTNSAAPSGSSANATAGAKRNSPTLPA